MGANNLCLVDEKKAFTIHRQIDLSASSLNYLLSRTLCIHSFLPFLPPPRFPCNTHEATCKISRLLVQHNEQEDYLLQR